MRKEKCHDSKELGRTVIGTLGSELFSSDEKYWVLEAHHEIALWRFTSFSPFQFVLGGRQVFSTRALVGDVPRDGAPPDFSWGFAEGIS